MKTYSDAQIKEFLMWLIKEYYKQGDDYYVHRTRKGKWIVGYSNDYPLQHGPGESFTFDDRILNILMNNSKLKI